TPVEVTMKVNTTYLSSLRRDSLTLLSTAGVLGETYINIDSSQAKGETVHDGDTLPSRNVPDFSDMVRSGQSTLQNMDALLKLLKDPVLFDNANDTIANVKKLTDDINAGKGPIGKLAKDEQLAAKLENIINKLSMISDRLEAGEGSAGKLLRDPSLYNNADQM